MGKISTCCWKVERPEAVSLGLDLPAVGGPDSPVNRLIQPSALKRWEMAFDLQPDSDV